MKQRRLSRPIKILSGFLLVAVVGVIAGAGLLIWCNFRQPENLSLAVSLGMMSLAVFLLVRMAERR